MDVDSLIDYAFGIEVAASPILNIPDIVDWAEDRFYIVETARPIVLAQHQKDILRHFSERLPDGRFRWRNLIYSTIKKSGKTTMSALYARWAAECWGPFQEVYNMGNKFKQAKERAFKIARRSIELAPARERQDWDLQATTLTHGLSGSVIEALPISGAGEAGGNQSLSVWTELWGFQYEEALLMWDELKPVPTRPLSQRFVDTYAGFEGMSELLWEWWQAGLAGERLHDELPIYGNEAAGLIAYIDTGTEARRMPWQLGAEGEAYYREQALTERPENYRRHHLNEWATSVDSLINIALWDRLEGDEGQAAGGGIFIGADAAVSGDCTALSVIHYDPGKDFVSELETYIWTPPQHGKLDYDLTLLPALQDVLKRYRVVGVAYDEYQLHSLMTREAKNHRKVDWYAFPQGGERIKADTALVNRIRQGTLQHSGNQELREHVQNADGKASGDSALRIVKRASDKHIDAVVSLSMAAWRAAELMRQPRQAARQIPYSGLWRSQGGRSRGGKVGPGGKR